MRKKSSAKPAISYESTSPGEEYPLSRAAILSCTSDFVHRVNQEGPPPSPPKRPKQAVLQQQCRRMSAYYRKNEPD